MWKAIAPLRGKTFFTGWPSGTITKAQKQQSVFMLSRLIVFRAANQFFSSTVFASVYQYLHGEFCFKMHFIKTAFISVVFLFFDLVETKQHTLVQGSQKLLFIFKALLQAKRGYTQAVKTKKENKKRCTKPLNSLLWSAGVQRRLR